MSAQDVYVRTDTIGTYAVYLGAQYVDNPDPNDLTYSPMLTVTVEAEAIVDLSIINMAPFFAEDLSEKLFDVQEQNF